MQQRERNFALDVLRGIAILLVLLRHVPAEPASGLMRFFFELGWTGVDLFFVLSGFLISGLLYQEIDRTGTLRLGRFWLRRGFKIWPSYFACFGLMVATATAFNLSTGNFRHARNLLLASLPNLVFVQNYTGYQWPHTWSLAIEEHFYLALPLLLVFLVNRRSVRKLPAIVLCVCVCVLALRVCMSLAGWTRWQSFYYPTHLRIDALAFGVLLGYLHRYRRARFDSAARRLRVPMVAILPLLSIAFVFPLGASPVAVTFGFTVIYLAYGALVVIAGAYPDAGRKFPPARLVAWLGVYSYCIYLVHSAVSMLPVFDTSFEGESIWGVRALFWAASIGGGVALSHAVERPFLRVRRRLYPSDEGGAASHESATAQPLQAALRGDAVAHGS